MKKMEYSEAMELVHSINRKTENNEPLTEEETEFLFKFWAAYHPAECDLLQLLGISIFAGLVISLLGCDITPFLNFIFPVVLIPTAIMVILILSSPY